MKISIIIPVYNAAKTLPLCLASLFKSTYPDFEVIVVDDASTDNSREIINKFPCRWTFLEKNSGAAKARNLGAKQAHGDIFVFLDADVVVDPKALVHIVDALAAYPHAHALTGMLDLQRSPCNLYSDYKNIYMHYTFSKYIGEVDFLYGSLMAIHKKDFLPFDETYPVTDDTELGQRFKSLGKIIILSPLLKIVHLKEYSFFSLMRNDFCVPFWWARIYLTYHGTQDIFTKHRFSHSGTYQIINIFLVYLIIASIPFGHDIRIGLAVSLLSLLYLCNNFNFFRFIERHKNNPFLIPYILLTFLDHLIMGMGVVCGFAYFGLRNK